MADMSNTLIRSIASGSLKTPNKNEGYRAEHGPFSTTQTKAKSFSPSHGLLCCLGGVCLTDIGYTEGGSFSQGNYRVIFFH